MTKSGLLVIAGVAILTLVGLIYLALTFEPPQGTTTVVLPAAAPSPAPARVESAPAANSSSLPQIRLLPRDEPAAVAAAPEVAPPPALVEVPEPEPSPGVNAALPSLNNSDGFVLEALSGLGNGAALLRWVTDEQVLRKFVVLVHNVSQGEIPQTELPYLALNQEMPVRTLDDNLFLMDDAAFARFDPVLDAFLAVDTDAAIALYRSLSPLLQQAYAELGFGATDFDDTLRRAIENVLTASEYEAPYQLVKPSVMYLYADTEIENLSAVDKQLLRLGPGNRARLQARLRDFGERL